MDHDKFKAQVAIFGVFGVALLAWIRDLVVVGTTATGSLPWVIRQEGLYLTGLLSISLMSFAVLLAARPRWLERPLGGMDRMYWTHKWTGILAVAFGAMHWLVEMSDDVIKSWVGRGGRAPREKLAGLWEVLREMAHEVGEWAIYAVIAMLVLTLWKRFPYRRWRFLHQAMPVIYLLLAFHAAMLAPLAYWSRPAGVFLAIMLILGTYGAVSALARRVGSMRQVGGQVVAVASPAPDIVSITCRLDERWRGHRPGQFAFVTLDDGEGAHPFTIASADRGDRTVVFQIKALGDYTATLAQRVRSGQAVTVEGPYGAFDMARRDRQAKQLWVAGGIGVTPFLAWLEALQGDPQQAPEVDFHYCVKDRSADPFVPELKRLVAALPNIRLHVHGFAQGEALSGAELTRQMQHGARAEVWFCGPGGLANKLRGELAPLWSGRLQFHQEAFEMR